MACVAVTNMAAINVASGVLIEQGHANAPAAVEGGPQAQVAGFRRPVPGTAVNQGARVSTSNVVNQRGADGQGTITTPGGRTNSVGQGGQGTAQTETANRPIANEISSARAGVDRMRARMACSRRTEICFAFLCCAFWYSLHRLLVYVQFIAEWSLASVIDFGLTLEFVLRLRPMIR